MLSDKRQILQDVRNRLD